MDDDCVGLTHVSAVNLKTKWVLPLEPVLSLPRQGLWGPWEDMATSDSSVFFFSVPGTESGQHCVPGQSLQNKAESS